MAAQVLVNAVQIAKLAGAALTRHFAFNKLKDDPTFPKPFIAQNGIATLWQKSAIEACLEQESEASKGRRGRRQVQSRTQSTIDNTLALTFLSGGHKKPIAIKKTQTIHVKEQHL